MALDTLRRRLQHTGIMHWAAFYRDPQFYLALAAGVACLFGMWLALPSGTPPRPYDTALWLSLVVWQPVIEEMAFRGIIQGQLGQRPWAAQKRFGITAANALTSLLFVLVHCIQHPPLWAIAVGVPSLVFGHFRDRHQSVYPAIALHSAYNLGYLMVRGG